MTGEGKASMRIGLLGGTFDPVHTGHLVLAQECWHRLSLDKVIFIPAYIPPHKEREISVSAADRLNMIRISLEGDPRFGISTYEMDKKGVSYSIDTVRYMSDKYGPGYEFFFLMGEDLADGLDTWKEPEKIAELADFIVCTRPGWDRGPDLTYVTRFIPIPSVDVSSTMIRQRINNAEPIDYLVPGPVVKYIRNKGLYRE